MRVSQARTHPVNAFAASPQIAVLINSPPWRALWWAFSLLCGEQIKLTPGAHCELIRQVITEFAARFVLGAEVIYIGDTGSKVSYFQEHRLAGLGVAVDLHGAMPDVILYSPDRNWLLLVESVTFHGPVDAKRRNELAKVLANAAPGIVYVTAFPDRKTMARHLGAISWETEVSCADAPTHLIHFDGERFLGPYRPA